MKNKQQQHILLKNVVKHVFTNNYVTGFGIKNQNGTLKKQMYKHTFGNCIVTTATSGSLAAEYVDGHRLRHVRCGPQAFHIVHRRCGPP